MKYWPQALTLFSPELLGMNSKAEHHAIPTGPDAAVPDEVKKPGEWSVASEKKLLKKAIAYAKNNNKAEAMEWLQRQTGEASLDGIGSCTMLHSAVEFRSGPTQAPTEVVEVLLCCSADVQARLDGLGWTPLALAMIPPWRHDKVQLLVAAKSDPMAVDKDGETPWSRAKRQMDTLKAGELMGKFTGFLIDLIQVEGNEAVEVLENWMEKAQYTVGEPEGWIRIEALDDFYDTWFQPESIKAAHLSERLQVILAKEHSAYDPSVAFGSESYMNFSKQNLFLKPKVKAQLWYLPGLSAQDACHCKLLEAMVDTMNEAALQTPVVEAVVSSAWAQMRVATAWDVFCSILTVAFLCHASFSFRHHEPFGDESRLWIETC
eukprot:Skav224966  [mRNA]  locus=scaffold3807:10343:12910:+ [translate_table: standard]